MMKGVHLVIYSHILILHCVMWRMTCSLCVVLRRVSHWRTTWKEDGAVHQALTEQRFVEEEDLSFILIVCMYLYFVYKKFSYTPYIRVCIFFYGFFYKWVLDERLFVCTLLLPLIMRKLGLIFLIFLFLPELVSIFVLDLNQIEFFICCHDKGWKSCILEH